MNKLNFILKTIGLFLLLNFINTSIFSSAECETRFDERVSEKLYMQTDREIYIAGDYLFFKLYVVDSTTLKLTNKSKIAYISLRNEHSTNIINLHVKLKNGMAYGSIYLSDTLSSGYYQLLSFTNCIRNSNESIYFKRELFIANRFDQELNKLAVGKITRPDISKDDTAKVKITPNTSYELNTPGLVKITTDKTNYHNREKITFKIATKGTINSADLTELSVSVIKAAPQTLNGVNITDLLNKNSNYESLKDIRKIKFPNQFLPEIHGQILQGYIQGATDGKKIPNSCIFLSAKDSVTNLQYTYTDSSGMFRFLLDDYYDNKILNIKVTDANQKVNILFDDKFDFNSGFLIKGFQDTSQLRNFILECQNITDINKVYKTKLYVEDTIHYFNKLWYGHVYNSPDVILYPSDYVSLPNLFEISKELIPSLRIRKKDGRYVCNFFNSQINDFMSGSPLIFLDGVLIDDINQIINLNSDQIKGIEYLSKPWALGRMYLDGILSVYTKKHEIDNVQNLNNVRIVAGTTLHSGTFHSDFNDKGHKENYYPDFRSLLYWNPSIELQANSEKIFEFITSDLNGRYIIKVEGLTSDGKPICTCSEINILPSEK